MNHADGLLAAILERPDDPAPWLVMSDWLEEQGDPANAVRAEMCRLQANRAETKGASRKTRGVPYHEIRAPALLAAHPELAGALQPVLDHGVPVGSIPSALAMFLLADQTSVVEGPFAAGTTWEGELKQEHDVFPTVMQLRERQGNRFMGDMEEDFSSLFGPETGGKFYLRGVIVGCSQVAFVTYRMENLAVGPGLYQFRLNRLRRLNGTWQVGTSRRGKMWLKQKRD